MNIAVVYVYPMVNIRVYHKHAQRFADTYKQFPAGIGHELHVILNGGSPHKFDLELFAGIKCQWHEHSNVGWDIGAYQWAAESIPCDLLVCLGAPVHFWKPGWLDRMAEAYAENGPALYGCWGYLHPNWHLRTTVLWLPPVLLHSYPYQIGSTKGSRYGFEHGKNSITRHTMGLGLECYMVTWGGTFPFKQWEANLGPGPDESLVHDQHTHR